MVISTYCGLWGLLTLHRGPRLSWGRDPAARVSRASGAALPTHTGDLWPGSGCNLRKEGLERLLALNPAWELIGSRAEPAFGVHPPWLSPAGPGSSLHRVEVWVSSLG